MNHVPEPGSTAQVPRLGGRRARIADTLVAAVGARKLEPGAVYSAAALVRELGVSGEAFDEVMMDLAAEGLLEPGDDGGFRVSAPSVAELRDMIELRLLIEIPTVRQVTYQGVSDAQLSRLRRAVEATQVSARDGDILGYINADMSFHLQLLDLAGNTQLTELVRILRSRSRLHGLREEDGIPFMTTNADEHRELVSMIADGRSSDVDDLLRLHISRIAAGWPQPQGGSRAV
jgi:DNA-binding GntR family transcriptional regulator